MDDVLTPILCEVAINVDSFCSCPKTVVVRPLLMESEMTVEENVVSLEVNIAGFPVEALVTILSLLEMAET